MRGSPTHALLALSDLNQHSDPILFRSQFSLCQRGWMMTKNPPLPLPREYESDAKIICLVGSRRFRVSFEAIAFYEALKGHIVLSPVFASNPSTSEGVLQILRDLHRAKIRLADEVLVINRGGYIGEDTQDEVEYARFVGKKINLLEPEVKESREEP